MAQGKKKKKAAANPARGFATTSLPSKAKAKEPNDVPSEAVSLDPGNADSGIHAGRPNHAITAPISAANGSELKDMSPEQLEMHLEDSELQTVIDAHGDRCKADASRQVARLETERRQQRSQALRLNVQSWLPEDILEEVVNSHPDIDSLWNHGPSTLPREGASDDVQLLRLWTLQRVLHALNLHRVDEACRYVLGLVFLKKLQPAKDYIWGLADALEWYAVNVSYQDLPNYESVSVPAPRTQTNVLLPDQAGQSVSVLRIPVQLIAHRHVTAKIR